MHRFCIVAAFSFLFTGSLHAGTIALWNFNDAVYTVSGGVPEFPVDRGQGTMTSDFILSGIGYAAGSTVNSRDGDPAGQALRLAGNANNGGSLTWMVSTEGYETIDVSFAIQRTSTGFSDNRFFYSIDAGATWTVFGALFQPETSFALQRFDFGGIDGLNDNPDAGFRIVFDGATSSSGNNRIDNLVVGGAPIVPSVPTPVHEPSTIVLTGIGSAFLILTRFKAL